MQIVISPSSQGRFTAQLPVICLLHIRTSARNLVTFAETRESMWGFDYRHARILSSQGVQFCVPITTLLDRLLLIYHIKFPLPDDYKWTGAWVLHATNSTVCSG